MQIFGISKYLRPVNSNHILFENYITNLSFPIVQRMAAKVANKIGAHKFCGSKNGSGAKLLRCKKS